jgi:hypothetical protein
MQVCFQILFQLLKRYMFNAGIQFVVFCLVVYAIIYMFKLMLPNHPGVYCFCRTPDVSQYNLT